MRLWLMVSMMLLAFPVVAEDHLIQGDKSFLGGYPAINVDGSVNVVVEIPAGTTAKWEVRKSDGVLEWEIRDGKPRVVDFLGYPGNYGMIPRTLLPKSEGGDGDPLDVLILGDALPRGAVAPVKVIGMLSMTDGGDRDDKLIAVPLSGAFADVSSMAGLEARYPNLLPILTLWFEGYKGPGHVAVTGRQDTTVALETLEAAVQSYAQEP